jgi:hypothetical protein
MPHQLGDPPDVLAPVYEFHPEGMTQDMRALLATRLWQRRKIKRNFIRVPLNEEEREKVWDDLFIKEKEIMSFYCSSVPTPAF